MKTDTNRWLDASQYLGDWKDRSQRLLYLFDGAVDGAELKRFSEYGCGPNAPFKASVGGGRSVLLHDIKAWSDDCAIVDLNSPDFDVVRTDVAVLAGVAEYLTDIRQSAARLALFHDYLLVSYHPFSWTMRPWRDPLAILDKRARQSGWRNHYSLEGLLSALAGVAYPVAAERMGKQILLAMAFAK